MTTKNRDLIPVYVRIDPDLHQDLQAEADKEHRSLSAHCAYLLKQQAEALRQSNFSTRLPRGGSQ